MLETKKELINSQKSRKCLYSFLGNKVDQKVNKKIKEVQHKDIY